MPPRSRSRKGASIDASSSDNEAAATYRAERRNPADIFAAMFALSVSFAAMFALSVTVSSCGGG